MMQHALLRCAFAPSQALQAQKAEVQRLSAAAEALELEAAVGREAVRKLAGAEAAAQRLQEKVDALQPQAAGAQEVRFNLTSIWSLLDTNGPVMFYSGAIVSLEGVQN